MEPNQHGSAQPPPKPPNIVSLTPSASPSPRRLSSHFVQPSRPLKSSRQLAWVSLQGRLVGADNASSARAIGGGLEPELGVAWDLFSPIQRVLVVAVIAKAVADSKKDKQIFRLAKSVELRDQVLLSMQQKLDSLCEQLNNIKGQQGTWADMSIGKNVEFVFNEPLASRKSVNLGCGCQLCDHHQPQLNGPMENSLLRGASSDELSKYKYSASNAAEAEERRMSDLSDWNSSVTSSVDIQMNSFAIDQDTNNLKKECEEKEATIKELSTFLRSSEISGSKRITELEDIIRRKNMRITRLKKDMLVLEQKVMHLTRLRRSSNSNMKQQLPAMAENVLYDMESTTSPSSSDSDCPPKNHPQNSVAKSHENSVLKPVTPRPREAKGSNSLTKPVDRQQQQKARSVSPLKEKSLNRRTISVSSSSRKCAQSGSKSASSLKRWV